MRLIEIEDRNQTFQSTRGVSVSRFTRPGQNVTDELVWQKVRISVTFPGFHLARDWHLLPRSLHYFVSVQG